MLSKASPSAKVLLTQHVLHPQPSNVTISPSSLSELFRTVATLNLLQLFMSSPFLLILQYLPKMQETDLVKSTILRDRGKKRKRRKVKSLSRVRLFGAPWTAAHQAPLSVGFPRQGYWNELPCPSPGDLLDPRIKPLSPVLAGRFFTTEPPK